MVHYNSPVSPRDMPGSKDGSIDDKHELHDAQHLEAQLGHEATDACVGPLPPPPSPAREPPSDAAAAMGIRSASSTRPTSRASASRWTGASCPS